MGGETGATLTPLLDALPGERRIVGTSGSSGSYVVDRRTGERRILAISYRPAPQRHEVDDLVAATCASALQSSVLVMCNPFPAEGLPDAVCETVVANVRPPASRWSLTFPRLDSTTRSPVVRTWSSSTTGSLPSTGLGTGRRAAVQELSRSVAVRPVRTVGAQTAT
jgi:hypothetical protein